MDFTVEYAAAAELLAMDNYREDCRECLCTITDKEELINHKKWREKS